MNLHMELCCAVCMASGSGAWNTTGRLTFANGTLVCSGHVLDVADDRVKGAVTKAVQRMEESIVVD